MSLCQRGIVCGIAAAVACVIGAPPAASGSGGPPLDAELVDHVTFPTGVTHAPGDAQRLFVLEKQGRLVVIRDGTALATPFLDLTGSVESGGGEQGLLGLAFHPDYQSNGLFYVYYTRDDDPATQENETVLVRYQVSGDPDVADAASAQPVLVIAQPTRSHNGGWLGFGPDGMLYVSVGDGGGVLDPDGNAQNVDTLLGSILRIDVGTDGFPDDPDRNYGIPAGNPFAGGAGADEIWHYGLRNPWRCSFDRGTGDLYIGDVGHSLREEVDFARAGTSGLNFGWDCMEGTSCTFEPACACEAPELTMPLFDYPHPLGGPAVAIGGYVYRGSEIPGLVGSYLFADRFGPVRRLVHQDGSEVQVESVTFASHDFVRITAFGEDVNGELYFCDSVAGGTGAVFKVIAETDCNGNGVLDGEDIAQGFSADCDDNGIPDECQIDSGKSLDCNANLSPDDCDIADGTSQDLNGNGVPDECDPDCNGNGVPDFTDIGSGQSEDANGNGVPDECECLWDLDDDLFVGVTDFLGLLGLWGTDPGGPPDFDGSGSVDTVDLLELLVHWGPC